MERLGLLNFVPEVILDLGSGVGTESRTLAERFSDAYVVGLDICALSLRPQISTGKWAPVTGNANALPFAEATFDLVFANLVLPWCDPDAAIRPTRARNTRAGPLHCCTQQASGSRCGTTCAGLMTVASYRVRNLRYC